MTDSFALRPPQFKKGAGCAGFWPMPGKAAGAGLTRWLPGPPNYRKPETKHRAGSANPEIVRRLQIG